MKLFGLLELDKFKREQSIARKAIDAWILEVQSAIWKTPQCIKDRYRSADFLNDNKVIFDVKGNKYRVVAKVDYQKEAVLVLWVGTHAEYSKKKF